MTMRTLINLVEAKRPAKVPKPVVIDASGFYQRAAALARTFSRAPFFEKPNAEWVRAAQQQVLAKRRERDQGVADYEKVYPGADYDEEFGSFDAAEAMREAAAKVWDRQSLHLNATRRNIEDEEEWYQRRALERAGIEANDLADHMGQVIEASDWLSGMQAQVELAKDLSIMAGKDFDAGAVKEMLDALEKFATEFANRAITQQVEAPTLEENVLHVIARLPLLLMGVTRSTT